MLYLHKTHSLADPPPRQSPHQEVGRCGVGGASRGSARRSEMAWGPKKEREVLPKKSSELEPKLLLNAMVSVAQHHEHPKLLIAACIGSADAYGNKQADKHFEGRYAFLQQPAPVRIYSSSGANSALVRLVQDDDGKFRLMVAFRGTVLENDSQSKDFSASVINILQDLDFRQTHMSFESLNSCKTPSSSLRISQRFEQHLSSDHSSNSSVFEG